MGCPRRVLIQIPWYCQQDQSEWQVGGTQQCSENGTLLMMGEVLRPAPGFVKCESHSHCTTDSDHMARLTPFLAYVSHSHHCMLHLRKNSG